MNNLNTQLDELERSIRIQVFLFVFILILGALICKFSYDLGRIRHEREVILRAKELPERGDCYTNEDLEKVIFGEPQL